LEFPFFWIKKLKNAHNRAVIIILQTSLNKTNSTNLLIGGGIRKCQEPLIRDSRSELRSCHWSIDQWFLTESYNIVVFFLSTNYIKKKIITGKIKQPIK